MTNDDLIRENRRLKQELIALRARLAERDQPWCPLDSNLVQQAIVVAARRMVEDVAA